MAKARYFGYGLLVLVISVAVGLYFLAFYRITDDLVWPDVKRVLVNENPSNLEEFCREINALDISGGKVNYENITTESMDRYLLAYKNEMKVDSDEKALKLLRKDIYLKPTFAMTDIKKVHFASSKYPTLLENINHTGNDRNLIEIFLDDEERIVGWKSDQVNMRP